MLVVLFLLVQVERVQTYAGHRVAEYLSAKLKTRVEIGSLEIDFSRSVTLNNVFIQDLHKDTLLYSKKLKVDVDELNVAEHRLRVGSITMISTKAAVIKYREDHDLNLQFILDAFDDHDTTRHAPRKPWDISFGEVTLVNTSFAYRNEHDTMETTGIDFVDIGTRSINARFTDIKIEEDTIHGTVEYLSAIEKSGFILQNLSSYVNISPVGMKLDELKIKTPESDIRTDLVFKYKRYRDFLDFIDNVSMNAKFDHSRLEMSDLAYFAPDLKGVYKNISITGLVSGRVSDLRGKNMDIFLGGQTHYIGDFAFTGLPDMDQTLIHLNVKSLSTNYTDLKQLPIPPFDKQTRLDLPENIARLGNMNFRGTFTGLYNDFYAYGTFTSALGSLYTDLSVKHDYEKKKEFYKGKLRSDNFNVGAFLKAPLLGRVTANVEIDGSGLTLEEVEAKLKGTINSIQFNDYVYNNVAIEGDAAKQVFNGKLNVKDDNIDFDFNGKVDFSKSLPTLDFISTVNHADIAALHFINSTKKTDLSTQIIINVTGNSIDNLIGQVNFDNTIYKQDNEVYKLSVFNLTSEESRGVKTIKLFSDFCNAKVQGSFRIMDMAASMQNVLNRYLPSYINKSTLKNPPPQIFDYSFLFKKTDAVTRLFVPGIEIAPQTLLEGRFNSVTNELTVNGTSTRLNFYDYVLNNWQLKGETDMEKLELNASCEKLYLTDSLFLNGFNVHADARADSLNLAVDWDNKKTKNLYKGDLTAFLNFHPDKTIQFKMLPSEFVIADSVWDVNKANEVTIDTSYITVKELTFEHKGQSIAVNGVISENKKDELRLALNDFNLANLNAFTKASGLKLTGRTSGEADILDLYNNMVFTSNVNFRALFVNDEEVGDGDVESVWDKAKEALYLHGNFTLGLVPNILFSGYYYPKKEEDNLDMELNLQAIQMKIFEPYVKDYCSDFIGQFSGNVLVKGSVKKPLVSGKLSVNARKITVDYLNTSYHASHDITIENNSFGVENMVVFDANNNKAVVTGKVYHNNFRDWQLDFDMNLNKFMCLNTTEANNSLYYGKAYASGIVNISGFIKDEVRIDASVKTEKVTSNDKSDKISVLSKTENTQFFIPLSGPSEVSENNFITFVKADSSLKLNNSYNVELGGIKLDFDLEVTPDAEVQLIFDEKVGDVIKARGDGNIKLAISSQGDFKMYGDYVIENGDYLFTLQNIINKKFAIEKGSVIKWSGVPYKADLDITAIYKARASLKPFFPTDSSNTYKKRYPVDLKLAMTDQLLSPQITFGINIPTVDATTRQTVMTYINTEEEMNRQVFSLLILNSFVTPPQLMTAGTVTGNPSAAAGTAINANSTELLSNQLSNMLSKISKDFDIGVNYRPGDEISSKELGVALSTQLFDDRLSIDGNLGVNNNTTNQNTNNIVGDVNVDYKITDNGKLRIKAFNKTNDNNRIYSSGPYTQGVGVFYREEFDTIGELYERYLNSLKNRKKKKQVDDNAPPPEGE